VERSEIEQLVLGTVPFLKVELSDRSVYIRRLYWEEFEQFARGVSEYLEALSKKSASEEDKLAIVSGMVQSVIMSNLTEIPVEIVKRLVLAVTNSAPEEGAKLKLEDLNRMYFDDVLSVADIALRVHFRDNKKVKRFFGLVGSFLSVKSEEDNIGKMETSPD